VPVNPTTGQELQNAEQTDNFLKLDESLRENRHTFAPESLQYCSQKHCTLVPKFTALHFPEITVFLFPVYRAPMPYTDLLGLGLFLNCFILSKYIRILHQRFLLLLALLKYLNLQSSVHSLFFLN